MENAIHLLIVDDDIEIRNLLVKLLQNYNYTVFSAKDGNSMNAILEQEPIDLVILDVMMPGDDGLTLCRRIREKSSLPIIMLTAAGEETDRIVGLEIGADDYLTKPFNPRELIARIKAVLRRSTESQIVPNVPKDQDEDDNRKCIRFAEWQLDYATRELTSPEQIEIAISSGEYILLKTFVEHPQQVLSRDQLLDYTQHRTAGPFDRSIDVQVSRLRQKIESDPKKPQLIKTVRGGGYLFTPKVTLVKDND